MSLGCGLFYLPLFAGIWRLDGCIAYPASFSLHFFTTLYKHDDYENGFMRYDSTILGFGMMRLFALSYGRVRLEVYLDNFRALRLLGPVGRAQDYG